MNEVATIDRQAIMEQVLTKGDLAKMTPEQRNQYYLATCESLQLNPLTKPFDFINLGGKLVMYARRDCADQLRKLRGISIHITEKKFEAGMYCVTVDAVDKDGRRDEDMGIVAVPHSGAPEIRANCMLKAITKAKRRVTLSICGLGLPDESELPDQEVVEPSGEPRRTVPMQGLGKAKFTSSPPFGSEPDKPAAGTVPASDTSSNPTDAGADNAADERVKVELFNKYDEQLRDAAEGGVTALQNTYYGIPEEHRAMMNAAINRRHKPRAQEVDAESMEI